MKWKIELEKRKLDSLFERVRTTEDEEVQADLTKLLCVRCSGFLESSIKHLINEYINKTVPAHVERFIVNEIKNITNFKDDRLVGFLRKFSPDWANEMSNRLDERKSSSLNAVVGARHIIAHGGNDNLSYLQMKDYYGVITEIVQDLTEIIKK